LLGQLKQFPMVHATGRPWCHCPGLRASICAPYPASIHLSMISA